MRTYIVEIQNEIYIVRCWVETDEGAVAEVFARMIEQNKKGMKS